MCKNFEFVSPLLILFTFALKSLVPVFLFVCFKTLVIFVWLMYISPSTVLTLVFFFT